MQHSIAHYRKCLNPKFYGEDLIVQSNGKRKAPFKDREVANGVKKALTWIFPVSLQTGVKEKFVSFATRMDEYSDI